MNEIIYENSPYFYKILNKRINDYNYAEVQVYTHTTRYKRKYFIFGEMISTDYYTQILSFDISYMETNTKENFIDKNKFMTIFNDYMKNYRKRIVNCL